MTGPTLVWQPFDGRTHLWEWTLGSGETGLPVVVPHKGDKTVHAYGAFGGAIQIEGTLETFGTPSNFVVLTNPGGTPLSGKTSAFLETILQNCNMIRPVAAGGVSAVTVRLLMTAF